MSGKIVAAQKPESFRTQTPGRIQKIDPVMGVQRFRV